MSIKVIDAGLIFTKAPEKRAETQYIVLHHAAASVCDIVAVHKYHLSKGWIGIGYNYFIRKDGSVYSGRPEECVGAHCVGSPASNSNSIGICFEGNFAVEYMPEAQQKAGAALILDIQCRYNGGLKLNRHSDNDATACPGVNFPFEAIASIASSHTMFTDTAGHWAEADIGKCAKAGLLKGYEDGSFRPDGLLTRAELAAALARLIDK